MAKPVAIKHYDKLAFVDRYIVTRAQSINWDQEITDEDLEEIGHDGIVETIVDPNVPTTVTLNTNDWGSVDLLAQIFGEHIVDGTEYAEASGSRNDAVVESSDSKYQNTDIAVKVRNPDDNTLDRTVWIPNCQLTGISWSYSIDGNATESYTFRGNTDRHFFGAYKDGFVDIGTYASGTTFTTNLSAATYTGLYASFDGDIYAFNDGTDDLLTWSTTTVTVTAEGTTAGIPTLTSSTRIRVFCYAASPGSYAELDTGGIGAIKGSYLQIELNHEDNVTGSARTLRLQSVDINVNYTRDDIKELGNWESVGRPLSKQEVTVEATVLETDLEEWVYMCGASAGQWTNADTTGLERKITDSIGEDQELQIRVYDTYSHTNLLKTISVENLDMIRSPFSQDVGGNGQISLSLKGSSWSITGGGDVGRLSTSYPTNWPTHIA